MKAFLAILIFSAVSCGKSSSSLAEPKEPEVIIDSPVVRPNIDFQTLGVYLWPSWSREIKRDFDFWKACGYNTISFLIAGAEATEESLSVYYSRVRNAQLAGFKVEIVVFSNMGSNGQGFDPRDAELMKKRLKDIELIVTRLSFADVVTFFAGDPGGSPVVLGDKGVDYFRDMAITVKDMVKIKAPKALFNINVWAIAHWDNDKISPFTVEFWDKETQFTKNLLADSKWPSEIGVEFPMHNYYRSLALSEYVKANKTPELYPGAQDIESLQSKGGKRQWAWPYFLIDEVDDGYTGYLMGTHLTQSETRYIRDIVEQTRNLKMDGVIVNTSIDSAGVQTEALNVYATGRFSQDATLTADKVISEFASFIADEKTAPILAKILRYIENYSTWEASMPEQFRLKKFTDVYTDAQTALNDLATVRVNPKPKFPIPFAGTGFLARVRTRLLSMR